MLVIASFTFIAVSSAWFNTDRLLTFLIALICVIIVLYTTFYKAKQSKFKIREIAGLKAIEEAIGRATEMARPLLYTPGWGGDIQRPTTIASMNILGHVAHKTAQYDCELIYPTHDPVIMAVAQEVIKGAYAGAGYADRYKEDNIFYVSSSQFGYAAAVEGLISRLKPASVFLMGTFEAESLILAETGNINKAIQIAGTDSTIQLAFFIVACDYVLIGEELFAASGYLSDDHSIKASVRAQDIIKVLIALFLIVATIWVTIDSDSTWWKL